MTTTVVLAGCGNMGFAMLSAWVASKAYAVTVIEPDPALHPRIEALGVPVHDSPGALSGVSDVVVFAIKPQDMPAVVPDYRDRAHLYVSVAAGYRCSDIQTSLAPGVPIIRCMSNTPALVRAAMTVACPHDHVNASQRRVLEELMGSIGQVAWLEDEDLLDAVTALSGSGPAYLFHLVECMEAAGRELGLPAALARTLAEETVIGAGLLMRESSHDARELRRQVTSPGGTTEAAFEVLLAREAMQTLLSKAMAAARDRARALS